MEFIEEHSRTPVRERHEVLVCGGGVAGVGAALTAARAGRSVLLLEKSAVLGGLATLGLINWFEPLCNGRGRRIIGGLAEELLTLAIQYGYDSLDDAWRGRPAEAKTEKRYATGFSPQLFILALDELMRNEGVELLLDTVAARPVMDGTRCLGVAVENKTGREFYPADVVIDATGDADILFRAGVPCVQGKNFLTYQARMVSLEKSGKAAAEGRIGSVSYGAYFGSNLSGGGHPEGVKLFEGTNARDVTEFILEGRRLLFDAIRNDDRLSRDVVTLPGMAQLRTTRHIAGGYELTEQDTYRHFDDSVGAVCDFTRRDDVYEVPFRALFHRDFGNLITAGRTISASGHAWDVTRVIPPAILTGQAAGQAAALSVGLGVPVSGVPVDRLQRELSDAGVMIHF